MKINPDNAVIAIVVGSFLFAGCGLALAADGERPRPTASEILEKDDANDNGVIDADEFTGPSEHFDNFDTDGNGSLSKSEIEESLSAGPPPRGEGNRSDRPRR